MNPPKTILVASDLSEQSTIALRRAALLCQEHGARLELLHVVEGWSQEKLPALAAADRETLRQKLLEQARERLERQAGQVAGQAVACCRIEAGKDFVVIIRTARQVEADLTVIGARGGHSLRELFLGTTAERVVRKGGAPVLVVRKPSPGPYRRVLVPTDFSAASRQALLAALALAPRARFDLLHVYALWGEGRLSLADAGEEARERYDQQAREGAEAAMTEWLQGVDFGGRRVARHFRRGYPGALVPAAAGELEAELVAMGTAGRSGLPYILLGSVTEHVLREAPCDVLTVRPAALRFELP